MSIRLPTVVLSVWMALSIPGSESTGVAADELGDAVRQAMKSVDPMVVRLRPVGSANAGDPSVVVTAPTTGLVVSDQGEILTSSFALQGNPQAIVVETIGGRRYSAGIVATDHVRKLVLLRVKESPDAAGWRSPAIPPGNAAQVGEWAICAGRFYAADSSSVSVGIISARDRIHGLALQTDCKVSPINYGGPLLDLNGTVHGILIPMSPRGDDASAGVEWYDSGIGFAIPLEDAMQSVVRLREGRDLLPGKLGISLKSDGMFSAEMFVHRIVRGGPADKAGMKMGDRLLTAAGVVLERQSLMESVIASRYAGDSITFEIQRQNEQLSLTVELSDKLPKVEAGYLGLLPIAVKSADSAVANLLEGLGRLQGDQKAMRKAVEPADPGSETPPAAPVADDLSQGVDVIVLEDSPAARAGLSGTIRVIAVTAPGNNGEIRVQRLPQLISALGETTENDSIVVRYRASNPATAETESAIATTESQIQSVTLAAGSMPKTEIRMTNRLLTEYRGTPNSATPPADPDNSGKAEVPAAANPQQIKRDVLSLDESGNCTVLSDSQTNSPRAPGMLVLISTAEQSEESVVRRWQQAISTHQLVVAIPANPEKLKLTTEDLPLIAASIVRVSERFQVDRFRIVVVAGAEQSEIAQSLALSSRSTVRGLAMESGWFSALPGLAVGELKRSVLLLEGGRDRQTQALSLQAQSTLRDAGLRVYGTAAGSDGTDAADSSVQRIADWSLLIKSL